MEAAETLVAKALADRAIRAAKIIKAVGARAKVVRMTIPIALVRKLVGRQATALAAVVRLGPQKAFPKLSWGA